MTPAVTFYFALTQRSWCQKWKKNSDFKVIPKILYASVCFETKFNELIGDLS